ncbi:MAG TPA: hypothetical protein VF316_14220 [Polyangiaceae bacterium]
MEAAPAIGDREVVIPVDAPANVEAASGFQREMFEHALAGLQSLQFGGVVLDGKHELVGRVSHLHFAAAREEVELHASVDKILNEEARSVHVAAQTGLVARDHDVETPRLGGDDQREDGRPLLEFRATNRVIDELVLGRRRRPPVLRDVAAGLFKLYVKARLLVFVGRPSGVDRASHGLVLRLLRPMEKVINQHFGERRSERPKARVHRRRGRVLPRRRRRGGRRD